MPRERRTRLRKRNLVNHLKTAERLVKKMETKIRLSSCMKRVQLQMKIMQMQVTEPNRREDQGGKFLVKMLCWVLAGRYNG